MNLRVLKRCFYITCVIVLASVIASVVIADFTTDTSAAREVSQKEVNAREDIYLLTCKGDIVVAYKNETKNPYITTTTAVSSLPYDIQEKLREGIYYSSRKELMSMINEICS